MRTFLALELPDPIRAELCKVISHLKSGNNSGIKWVASENLHITFQFIGETHRHDLNEISDIMENIFTEISPTTFSNAAIEIVPQRDPKIIWISLQSFETKLITASKQLKKRLSEMGYRLDKKHLKFHITLGRIKKRLPEFFIKQILTTELNIGNFEVEKASLYQSFLKPEGPVYEDIINYYFTKE
jgi:RNA 2',3'-cyclic 3'-phosphodiesterase